MVAGRNAGIGGNFGVQQRSECFGSFFNSLPTSMVETELALAS
jgi:hypothetical protein